MRRLTAPHRLNVMCHISQVTCHISHVMCIFLKSTDKAVKLFDGGSVINDAYPSSFFFVYKTQMCQLTQELVICISGKR